MPDQSPPVRFPAPFSVDIALSHLSHDRAGEHRTDDAWLATAWDDPATRVLVLSGGEVLLDEAAGAGGVRWLPAAEAPEGTRIFLGQVEGASRFAVVVEEPDPERQWGGLRVLGPALEKAEQGLVVHAVAIAEWQRSHRWCPRCAGRLESTHAGHVLTCVRCGRHQFPRTDPAVIMLVTDGERALLGRQAVWPPGRYSTLAGFVDPGESLEQAVAREVREEAGVEVTDVTYFGNQPWPFPASLMVGFFARATTSEIDVDGEEIEHARWFSREEMRQEAEAGTLVLPGGISISRSLIEAWYGGPLPGSW